MPQPADDRIFVRPRKHFRPGYSTTEVAWGALALTALACVIAWIAWSGAHPRDDVLGGIATPVRRGETPAERGPIPKDLAPGFTEQKPAVFDVSNLYVKIDGREGYYRSFGFQKLWCLTLTGPGGEPVIDLELYDLGSRQNALGAAAGELPEGSSPDLASGGLALVDRNALYDVRGKLYLRAIGSSDDAKVRAALAQVRDRFDAAHPAEPLPWSYRLFLGLGVLPARISFQAENAFSFGFADNVHTGGLADGDTELFVTDARDAKAAQALAARFAKGFAEYGAPLGKRAGAEWFKDRYLSRASAAVPEGRLVIGVHGAVDDVAGAALLGRLAAAARALKDADLAEPGAASPAQSPPAKSTGVDNGAGKPGGG